MRFSEIGNVVSVGTLVSETSRKSDLRRRTEEEECDHESHNSSAGSSTAELEATVKNFLSASIRRVAADLCTGGEKP